ncbi:MAG TPA: hypothetical protein VF473_00470 [Cyclobacteriaceae bacterium]
MKRFFFILLICIVFSRYTSAQSVLGDGEQPQVTIDNKGLVRIVFGRNDKILYSSSKDRGASFSKPVLVSEIEGMHLGMTRGPQLASSKDFSVVAAMDKKGNIHSFVLNHKNNSWTPIKNVNDVEASAPEGLMGITADSNNNFYAVWLDIREDKRNNICFASMNGNSSWSKNRIIYKSPDGHVCECCKPSVAAEGGVVSVMFRNWVSGSRDLYLGTSTDKGQTFATPEKLGTGTWKLNACPMDGGALAIDSKNNIHTVWQRDGQIFSAMPGQPETMIGKGRGCTMSNDVFGWSQGTNLLIKHSGKSEMAIGDGSALKLAHFNKQDFFAVWENNKKIVYQTMR